MSWDQPDSFVGFVIQDLLPSFRPTNKLKKGGLSKMNRPPAE
jgi:hypothetical protein